MGVFSAAKVLADAAKENVHTYTRRRRAVSTNSGGISTTSRLFSTAKESVSTAGASMPVSTAGMVQEVNISIPSPVAIKDKDCKRNWMKKKDKGWLEFMKQLNLLLRKNRKTLEQELKLMKSYLEDYKQRKGISTVKYSFDELKELFETTMKNVNTFVPMETGDRGRASELAAGSSQAKIIDSAKVKSSKRDAEAELDHEGSKRQKTNEASGSVQEQPKEEERFITR
ncbi:hypothetical protein Tco_0018309 [Tanacetum coccineum]